MIQFIFAAVVRMKSGQSVLSLDNRQIKSTRSDRNVFGIKAN